jgi:hypothetical protein
MQSLHQHQKPEPRLLVIPPDLPLLKYQFGQQVQWEQEGQHFGIIRGLQYFTPRMSDAIVLSAEWVGWWYLVELDPTCSSSNGLEDVHEQDLKLWEGTPCRT